MKNPVRARDKKTRTITTTLRLTNFEREVLDRAYDLHYKTAAEPKSLNTWMVDALNVHAKETIESIEIKEGEEG
jgi:uncharacterized protein (DUF1778 family)